MIISLVLALLATVSGALATYLYDESSSLAARLCAGACVGLASLGLLGFIFASRLGLTPIAILLTIIVLSIPALLATRNATRRAAIEYQLATTSRAIRRALLHPTRAPLGNILFYGVVTVVLWKVFSRAMIELPEGIYTGVLNNFGDLPFHLSVITGFAYGNNFPPEDPTYAGVHFTYPFLTDFVSAMFVRCGASLRESMFIENLLLAISLVGVLHRWAWEMLRNRLAAMLTPLLVLLNGGLGWVLLWQQSQQNEQGLFGILKNLPPSFTVIPDTTWRWGNAVSALLLPQRGILMGLPLAIIVFTQWWMSQEGEQKRKGGREKERINKSPWKSETGSAPSSVPPLIDFSVSPSMARMIAAGVIAGLLPLVHAHSFVVVMVVGAGIALLQRRWREWLVFFLVATIIALPQMWWSTHASAVDPQSFLAWQFGWDRGKENALWFWFKNSGIFIPLTVAAILWRHQAEHLVSRRLLLFFLPFTLCFIVPNLLKMAPWVWDNIKVLIYWWVASAPLVALLLAHLWKQGKWARVTAGVFFVCLTLAGSLDVAAIAFRSVKYQIFDRNGVQFAELIKEKTEPRALIIHAPVHNDPVFLTGRRSLMGYPGHIWTHGLEFAPREAEIKRIYSGAPDAGHLVQQYRIQFAVVSPLERNVMSVNDRFFSSFQKIGEVGDYRLYKTTP